MSQGVCAHTMSAGQGDNERGPACAEQGAGRLAGRCGGVEAATMRGAC